MKTILSAVVGATLALPTTESWAHLPLERKIGSETEAHAWANAANSPVSQEDLQRVFSTSDNTQHNEPQVRDGLSVPTGPHVELIQEVVALDHKSLPDATSVATPGRRVQQEFQSIKLVASEETRGRVGDAPDYKSSDAFSQTRKVRLEADEARSVEEVIVTGSHIRGAAPIGSSVITIDRDEIAASGFARVQDFFEQFPQNFSGSASEDSRTDAGVANLLKGQAIDLRGLGASATLVLVNGRRQPAGGLEGSFVDISSIATSALERIEILPDGASAIYGSDAIGGVVNFVLRKDYEGLETNVRFSSADGSAEELRASQIAGWRWTGGNLLLGYEYVDRDALMVSDTPYSSRNGDFRALGGGDQRLVYGSPGTILDPATFGPAYAIPRGQDGVNLTVSELLPGEANYWDQVTGIAALPEQVHHNAFMMVSQDISERFQVFLESRFGRRNMDLPSARPIVIEMVPSSNPFYVNPFGDAPLFVGYNFGQELGVLTQSGRAETYSATIGSVVKLGEDWAINVAGTYGREENLWRNSEIDSAAVSSALADPDPATSLNLFSDGGNNNPDTIAAIRRTEIGGGVFWLRSLTAIADGPLFALPAGTVKLAIGADVRDEKISNFYDNILGSGLHVAPSRVVGDLDRQVIAAFTELNVPILSNGRQASQYRGLEFSLAARYEDYSDFGSTLNPRFGVTASPWGGVTLRAAWATSFRAPRFNEISPTANPSSASANFRERDPQSPTGFSEVLQLSGNNPDIQEETATVRSAGIDFAPPWAEGLILSTTYFDINYEDKIQRNSQVNILSFEDEWAEIITRDPSPSQVEAICSRSDFRGPCPLSPAAIIDRRLRNIAGLKVSGIDVSVQYRLGLPLGEGSAGISGTYLTDYERSVSSTSRSNDVVDTVGNPLSLRLRGKLSWAFNGWKINMGLNYTGGYRDTGNQERVDKWMTVDSTISYALDSSEPFGGTVFQLGATNVFDEAPPFVDIYGYDAANATEIGRMVSFGVTHSW